MYAVVYSSRKLGTDLRCYRTTKFMECRNKRNGNHDGQRHVSYAELYGKNNHGDFRNYYEADKLWSAGAVAKSITHLKKYSLIGSFSFDHTSGKDMSGSMFIHPGFYPVDLLEFTPGRKDLQT